MKKNTFIMMVVAVAMIMFGMNAGVAGNSSGARSIDPPKMPISGKLIQMIQKGLDEQKIVAAYRSMMKDSTDMYDFREGVLNEAGKKMLADKDFKTARILFSLNLITYPGSFDAYTGLGEAYIAENQVLNAFDSYQRALTLRPSDIEVKKKVDLLAQLVAAGL